MGLTIPGPGTEPGLNYAIEISNDLPIIAAHDHTTGKGVKVPVAGLNINEDIPLNQNNLNQAASIRFHNYGFNLSGPDDICSAYTKAGDLWYNNAVGTPVQVTNASGLSLTGNFYVTKLINSNASIVPADVFDFLEVNSFSGALSINLPAVSSVTNGRFFYIKDVGNFSATNNITLVRSGTDTFDSVASNRILNTNLGTWMIMADGTSNWVVSYFTTKVMMDGRFGTDAQNVLVKGNTVTVQALTTNNLIIGDTHNAVAINGDTAVIAATLLTVTSPTTHIDSPTIRLGTAADSSISLGHGTGGGTNVMNAPTACNYLFTSNANAIFNSSTTIGTNSGNALTINATSTVISPFTINGSGTLNVDVACASNLAGNTTIGASSAKTLTVNASSNFIGPTAFNANVNVQSTSSFTGAVTFASGAPIELRTIITPTGAGRKLLRVNYGGSTSSVSYGPATWDVIHLTSNLSGTTTYTLSNTGAAAGDMMRIGNVAGLTSNTLNIVDAASAATINSWNVNTTGATSRLFYFDGTNWKFLA